jgi:hypothetical protein
MSEMKLFSDSTNPVLWPNLEGLASAIKRAAALDIKECPQSREEVADRLSQLLRRNITVAQIDAVLAETKPHRFPAEWIPAWLLVTGSRRVLDVVCAETGLWVADETERAFARYGRASLEHEKAAERTESLKKALWSKV